MKNIQNSQKEQVLRTKCSVHPRLSCDMLLLDPNENQHRVCSKCIEERNLFEKVISITELLNMKSSDKLPIYPLVDNENLQNMIKMESNIEVIYDFIEKYYQQLLTQIEAAIRILLQKDCDETKQQLMKWKIQSNKLQNLLDINSLQESVLSQERNSDKKLHQLVVQRYAQIEKDMIEIQQGFSQISQFESKFSMKQPETIQNIILEQIELIDLFQCKSKTISLSKKSFVPSLKFYKSSMKIQLNCENNSVSIFNTSDYDQQCYLKKLLAHNTNYLISLTYNHISKDKIAYFSFGLISAENKHSKHMDEDNNIWYHQIAGGKANKIVKGNNLLSGPESKGTGIHEFEIHFNIQDKIFRVCSADYKNCQELDDKKYFEESKQYYFAIYMGNVLDEVTVHKIQEVHEFPYLMK